jgi:hypothetical protein
MPANPYTQLSLPVTLNDMLKARESALRLFDDARTLIGKGKQLLEEIGPYLMPVSAQLKDDSSRVIAELDQSMWRRAFDLTGFKQLMDAQAVSDFERSLYPKPPEFNEANIRATFIDLHMQADEMFRRGIVNVFRYLSDDYKTNSSEPFRIGPKVIIQWTIEPSFRRGLQIRSGAGDRINDIDRVIKTLDGKTFAPRTLEYAINAALANKEVFEDDYYRAKGFKNGNLHLEFKRNDLLDSLNYQIAKHYGAALAKERH